MAIRSIEYLQSLVRELIKVPSETEWVEFKCNNKDPQMIGEYISALSNSAALCEKTKAYLVWGVQDDTRLNELPFNHLIAHLYFPNIKNPLILQPQTSQPPFRLNILKPIRQFPGQTALTASRHPALLCPLRTTLLFGHPIPLYPL